MFEYAWYYGKTGDTAYRDRALRLYESSVPPLVAGVGIYHAPHYKSQTTGYYHHAAAYEWI